MRAGPALSCGTACLPNGSEVRSIFGSDGPPDSPSPTGRDGNRDDLPVLLDGHRDVLELRYRPFDRYLQRPGLTDDAIRFADGDCGRRFAARDVEDRGDANQEKNDESTQPLHEEN